MRHKPRKISPFQSPQNSCGEQVAVCWKIFTADQLGLFFEQKFHVARKDYLTILIGHLAVDDR
jgi:hypothetical protein